MFSKACEYGIKSAIYVAEQSIDGRRVSIKDVTKAINSPEAYTSKILQQLKNNGLINSDRGPGGGFSIDPKTMEKMTLSDIVTAFDGDSIYRGCGLGFKKCNAAKPCPVHHEFAKIRDQLAKMLSETTIKSLALQLQDGLSFLKT
ncbi:MAG: transcriptional regulator [Verrucomicrobia bacterium]|nr:transcriptional regulator [Verrucomicrobiota bacterium]|tara:strand:+ start:1249 stop:1683 length:435 start_codon:yes stop_codon:yes gene_type:complete